MTNRRDALKALAGVPLGALSLDAFTGISEARARSIAEAAKATSQLKPGPEIYESIGVEPVINCRGTFTIIGGSVHRPEVGAAMESAAQYFVQMDELTIAVGERLAELTGAFGIVSAGCAAGLKHVTAAAVTGGNPEKLIRIPNLTGFEKTEVIAARSRNVYDHAIRNVGVTMISVNTLEEFEEALNPRTAMVYLTSGSASAEEDPEALSLESMARLTKPRNVPILLDVAAQDLVIPNPYLARGATVVGYSGGKVICGPQCAGLLLGDRNLLMAAWQASSPHHGPGRDNKVGREETLGMLAAVEAWVTRDHAAEWQMFLSWLDLIARRLNTIESVKTEITEPTRLGNHSPRLEVSWDPERLHITGEEVATEVGYTKPRIALGGDGVSDGRTSISITAFQMQPGNAEIVADRLHDVLSQRREPRSTSMAPPAADLTGRWDVTVHFFTSEGQHTLFVEKQDGNWLQGSHKSDFAVQDMTGTIEGNRVKFQSRYRVPGNSIRYIFSGTVSGDTMSGDIHLGEYLWAKFTATRYEYPDSRTPVAVPQGQPLAT